MKILTIVGARPQFIKAAMVSRAIIAHNHQRDSGLATDGIEEVILHTGQHYDENMSLVFFEQMNIPRPKYNLAVGSGLHGETTGRMLEGIEKVILDEKPDWLLLYGDTNSTLAGALAAAKLHVPVAHVEAGLRSFNRKMPEEINRVLTDHASTLLFCPTSTAGENLKNEGVTKGVHLVGDVMYDAALAFAKLADEQSTILTDLDLQPKNYYLATAHRAENTDDPERLRNIFNAFDQVATESCPLILPLHPRTKGALLRQGIAVEKSPGNDADDASVGIKLPNPNIRLLPPISFIDMVMLEKHAKAILTDSGGVQKEAYFHGVPCITLRDETEWIETVEAGWNMIVGADTANVSRALYSFSRQGGQPIYEYGTGQAGKMIVELLIGKGDVPCER